MGAPSFSGLKGGGGGGGEKGRIYRGRGRLLTAANTLSAFDRFNHYVSSIHSHTYLESMHTPLQFHVSCWLSRFAKDVMAK